MEQDINGTDIETALNGLPAQDNKALEPPAGLSPVSNMREEFYSKLYYNSEYDGILTGFNEIDQKLHGLKGIVTLAGTPKTGKTTLALQLALGAHDITGKTFNGAEVKDLVYVLFYSLELSASDINLKLLTHLTKEVNTNFIRYKGRQILETVGGVKSEGFKEVDKFPLIVDQREAIKAGELARLNLSRFFLRSLETDEKPNFETLDKDLNYVYHLAEKETAGTGLTPRVLVIIDHLQIFQITPDEAKRHGITSSIDTENYLIESFNSRQKKHKNLVFLLISQFKKDAFSSGTGDSDGEMEGVKGSVNITYLSSTIMTMRKVKDIHDTQPDGKHSSCRIINLNATDRNSGGIENMLIIFNPQAQSFHHFGRGYRGKGNVILADEKSKEAFRIKTQNLAGEFDEIYGVSKATFYNEFDNSKKENNDAKEKK